MHPLVHVTDDPLSIPANEDTVSTASETNDEILIPEVLGKEPSYTPLPQKTGNGNGPDPDLALPTQDLARTLSPRMVKRLSWIALNSPNHHAARAACRDILQVGGFLTEHTRVDIVVSFRALFAQMTTQELDDFLHQKQFPDRLKGEAMKLLEHTS